MSQSTEERELVVNINYEIFVLVLVGMSLINWALILLLEPAPPQAQVLWVMNLGLSIFLLLDFAYRVWVHPQRWRFIGPRGGWLLLVGSLPLPFFGAFRFIWAWLAFRRLRRADFRQMSRIVVQRRAQSTLLTALLAATIMLEAGAVLVLDAESKSTAANITTGLDALWWNIVTLSTVGYGDKYPVTTAGRLVGVGVIIAGVGLFSAITSFLAQWFLKPHAADAQTPSAQPIETAQPAEVQNLNQLTVLLRTYDVQLLLADTQRPPADILAELRLKVAEINRPGGA